MLDAKSYLTHPAATISGLLANPAPMGTKLFLLDLGTLECDSGFLLKGGNTSTKSNLNPGHERRKLSMFSVLIDIPIVGAILFDLGPGPGVTGTEDDYEKVWGGVADVFCRVLPSPDNELPVALGKIGYKLEDIKHVIISHLHLDHSGGLTYFKGRTDVNFWVSETELKHCAWAIGTGHELGAYLPHYFDLGLNWKTVTGDRIDIFPGITLLSLPGHTPGLMGMQVTLSGGDGVMIFTGDHIHIKENYVNDHIQGWLATNSIDWYRSTQTLKMLQRATNARIVFGHDFDTTRAMYEEKPFFE